MWNKLQIRILVWTLITILLLISGKVPYWDWYNKKVYTNTKRIPADSVWFLPIPDIVPIRIHIFELIPIPILMNLIQLTKLKFHTNNDTRRYRYWYWYLKSSWINWTLELHDRLSKEKKLYEYVRLGLGWIKGDYN